MKYHFKSLLLLFSLLPSLLFAQASSQEGAAREVPAIEHTRWQYDEYQNASSYWRQIINLDRSNEDSWLNLYKSIRYAEYGAHDKDIEPAAKQELESVLAEMKAAVPNSFAFHYCTYLQKGRTISGFESLKQAISLGPGRVESYDDALSMYLINHDKNSAKTYAWKIRTETPFDAVELQYNANVLLSLEQGAVFITNGYADTYPILVMQELDGVRTDVKVVCLDWLQNETYRQEISILTGVDIPAGNRSSQLAALLSGKAKSPIYTGLTIPPAELSKYKKELFATGLALKHSPGGIQNYASLAYNWGKFMKDKITVYAQLNRNYLIPLFHLRTYYAEQKNDTALKEVESYITGIAAHTDQQEKINTLLRK